jgi:ferredoxin
MYRVNEAICTGCGDCVEACPAEAIALIDERPQIDGVTCTDCGSCADACPQGAIVMVDAANPAYATTRPGARMPAVIPPTTSVEVTNLAHRPEIEVLPVESRRNRLWPTVGGALIWAARELLPEVMAVWRASRAGGLQATSLRPDASGQRMPVDQYKGHRHRWGRA